MWPETQPREGDLGVPLALGRGRAGNCRILPATCGARTRGRNLRTGRPGPGRGRWWRLRFPAGEGLQTPLGGNGCPP